MFRALVNQAITRVDPLKFNFNLGNIGNATGTNTQSPPINTGAVPTPAPIIDSRVLDLITLIRAIQPGLEAQQHQTNAKLTSSVHQPSIIALPVATAPVSTPTTLQIAAPNSALTASGLVASSPATQLASPAQIIIVPQLMKTSASEKVEAQVLPTEEENTIETIKPTIEPTEEEIFTTEKPKKKVNKQKKKKKSSSQIHSDQDTTIVFEAVGVHPTMQL